MAKENPAPSMSRACWRWMNAAAVAGSAVAGTVVIVGMYWVGGDLEHEVLVAVEEGSQGDAFCDELR